MNSIIRFGVIGLGGRGKSIVRDTILNIDNADVTAICDLYPDRVEDVASIIKEKRGHDVFTTTDYEELLKRDDIDAVYIATYWETHLEVTIAAIKAGKPVGVEVGGAYEIEELERLVSTWEEYKTPFMFMENCCFGKDELLATALHRKGIFGDVVHCSGAYSHDLREEITGGNINRHYRLRNYRKRNAENYPTHEFGPIAKLMNINRGNRLVSLTSVASRAAGLEQYILDHPELCEKDETLKNTKFNQGDIVHTIITCAGGETILLKLDTTLPRSYSREFTVRGTKGAYFMDTYTVFLDGMKEYSTAKKYLDEHLYSAEKFEEHLPKCWVEMTDQKMKNGHGGIDAIMFETFIECMLEGREFPIDIYDAATWMAITALSEKSISLGGMPQSFPDFTNGKWLIRKPLDVVEL